MGGSGDSEGVPSTNEVQVSGNDSLMFIKSIAGLTVVLSLGHGLHGGSQAVKKDEPAGANAPSALAATETNLPPIHIARWGKSGPTFVLVHGSIQGGPMGGDGYFAPQQKLAERGWRIVVPDRPGPGQSPTRGPDDVVADAEWVAELLGDGAHLVGHSFGGAVALVAAGRRPDAVRSLTRIEPALLQLASDDPEVQAFQAKQGNCCHRIARRRKSARSSPGLWASLASCNAPPPFGRNGLVVAGPADAHGAGLNAEAEPPQSWHGWGYPC